MFLDTIVDSVREELELKRRRTPVSELQDRPLFGIPRRGFTSRLEGQSRHIIAEIKKASPSQGLIRENFNPTEIAQTFESHGASALSVLTEERFFQGSLLYLERIKEKVSLPLLRKDFILDSYQLFEAKSFGADAVLLIAALLDASLLGDLRNQAHALTLDVLVEVHTEAELERALKAGAKLIGINNRDLRTFEVKLETTERLMPMIPEGVCVVCESGIDSTKQIKKLERLGIHTFLVGESLMRATDPGAKLKELLEKD
jgi:indole-3-glycerol phosphate synthase